MSCRPPDPSYVPSKARPGCGILILRSLSIIALAWLIIELVRSWR